MSATKSGSISEEPKANGCGVCSNEVDGKEKAMQCDLCNRWVHTACCSMPDDLYKTLVKHEKKRTGVKWFCKVCEIHFGKVKLEIKIVEERQVVVEVKQVALEGDLMEIKREVGALKQELKEFVKVKQQMEEVESVEMKGKYDELKTELSEIKKSYSDTVQSGNVVGDSVRNSTAMPNREIKVEVSELMEREKRKNNLVIFGIEETNDEFATKDKVNEIVRAVGLEENKIKYFGRVGRLVAGAKPRIVRVVCEDNETKRKFLKESNRLKTMDGFANKYVAMDLTKAQQLQDKNLREKLKEIRERDKDARINNGEIVIFENSSRKVLYSCVH